MVLTTHTMVLTTHTMVLKTHTMVITKHKTFMGHITLVVRQPLIERTKLKVISIILKVVRHKRFKVIRRTKLKVISTRRLPLTEHTKLKVIHTKLLVERIRLKVIERIRLKVIRRIEPKVIGRIRPLVVRRIGLIRPLTKVNGLFVSRQPGIRFSLRLSLMEYTLHICPGTLGERIRSNTLLRNSL